MHVFHTLKHHFLTLKGDKDIFDSILKPLIIQSLLAIAKDINFKDSDDSPILNYKAIN